VKGKHTCAGIEKKPYRGLKLGDWMTYRALLAPRIDGKDRNISKSYYDYPAVEKVFLLIL
jgi:hypothetical protein